MRGLMPSTAIHSKCCLADQDGLAASLFDRFLSSLRELVRVNGHGRRDLSIIEDLDERALLAEKPQLDDLVEGEFSHILGSHNLGDPVKTEHLILHAENIREAALRQTAVKRH